MNPDFRVSADVLDEPDIEELVWRIIEPAYNVVSIYDGADALDAQLATLTPGQRALLAIHWTGSEISNGGFDQYFFNPTGDLAQDALEAFQRIGARKSEALLRLVFAAFPGGKVPRDREARIEKLESLEEQQRLDLFEEANDELYELMESEIFPMVQAYIRTHQDEFVVPRGLL